MISMQVFVFMLIAISVKQTLASENNKAKCECGVFRHPTPEKTKGNPLASKAPNFDFECNAQGKESCVNMCKALAEAHAAEGPKDICKLVSDTQTPFVPQIFYRACNDESWTSLGLKSSLKVCCKAKEVISCA